MDRKFVDVMDEIAEGDGGPVVGALGLEGISFHFFAKRMNALPELLAIQHPVKTTSQREIAT